MAFGYKQYSPYCCIQRSRNGPRKQSDYPIVAIQVSGPVDAGQAAKKAASVLIDAALAPCTTRAPDGVASDPT